MSHRGSLDGSTDSQEGRGAKVSSCVILSCDSMARGYYTAALQALGSCMVWQHMSDGLYLLGISLFSPLQFTRCTLAYYDALLNTVSVKMLDCQPPLCNATSPATLGHSNLLSAMPPDGTGAM